MFILFEEVLMISIQYIVGVISCAFLTLLVALGGCQSMTGKTAGQTMSDASISTAVQAKLTSDRLSNFTRINVDTKRGVVSLNGEVQNQEQRLRAERLAHQVDGVVKVNNNLQVQNQFPKTRKSSTAASANDDMRSGGKGGQADPRETTLQRQGVHIVQGTVSRIEGDTYFVQGQD